MIYVLDTDILSLLGHKDAPEAPRIRRRIAELPGEHSVVTTVINYEEQMRGWMAALSRAGSFAAEIQIYARLLQHLGTYRRMTVLGYETAAAAMVKRFRSQRLPIAAIVLSRDGVLVTRNLTDFRKVPGLRLEDWSTEANP